MIPPFGVRGPITFEYTRLGAECENGRERAPVRETSDFPLRVTGGASYQDGYGLSYVSVTFPVSYPVERDRIREIRSCGFPP